MYDRVLCFVFRCYCIYESEEDKMIDVDNGIITTSSALVQVYGTIRQVSSTWLMCRYFFLSFLMAFLFVYLFFCSCPLTKVTAIVRRWNARETYIFINLYTAYFKEFPFAAAVEPNTNTQTHTNVSKHTKHSNGKPSNGTNTKSGRPIQKCEQCWGKTFENIPARYKSTANLRHFIWFVLLSVNIFNLAAN